MVTEQTGNNEATSAPLNEESPNQQSREHRYLRQHGCGRGTSSMLQCIVGSHV
ncbi:hypothetical protein D4764_16G0009010 [Takifugu flavidus]|uniref:Uncharacterized protein n=1 Tax=Takifugu flavidus TaxID=433684 RepID=A0A5C6NY10_9TELE|nr:hypothetical protein D4764_16G0009010 [Takifugu flavidus]